MVGYSKQLVRWRLGVRRYAQSLYGNSYSGSTGVSGRGEKKQNKKSTRKSPEVPKVFFHNIHEYYYYVPARARVCVCVCVCVYMEMCICVCVCARARYTVGVFIIVILYPTKPRPETDKIRRCGYHHLWGLDNILMSMAR